MTAPAGFSPFRKLTLQDKTWYEKFYSQFDPYADLSFSNLMLWLDVNNDVEVSILGDTEALLFRYSNPYDYNNKSYTILGRKNISDVVQKVFDFQDSINFIRSLSMTPNVIIEDIKKSERESEFLAVEDLDNRNYIFSVEEVMSLQGGKFEKLRYKINHYKKSYGDRTAIAPIDLSDKDSAQLILDSLDDWLGAPVILSEHIKNSIEGDIIRKQIQLCKELEAVCLGLYIDGTLCGFTIYHHLPQSGYIIANHIKCNYHYRYIFDYIYYALAQYVSQQNIRFINAEQDLGIEALRTHKTEMRPHKYLDVFSLSSR